MNIAVILYLKVVTHTHIHKRAALACHQCSLQGIVSTGTDGKPARARQHINPSDEKAANSKPGFSHWKGFGSAMLTV